MMKYFKWWIVIILCLIAIFYLAPQNIVFSVWENLDRYEVNDIAYSCWEVLFYKNIPRDHPQTRYEVCISPKGKIVGFNRSIPDTMKLSSLSNEEALSLAELYIRKKISR